MVRFKIKADASLLKTIAHTLSTIVDECRLEFHMDKLVIKATDPAHVAMITLELDSKLFHEYAIMDNQPGDVGIDIDKLKNVVREAEDHEIFRIQYDSDNDTYIRFSHDIFTDLMKPTDTAGMSRPKMPNLKLPGMFELEFSKMKKIIHTLTDFSDVIVFSFHCGEGLRISMYGPDEKISTISKAMIPKDLLINMEWSKKDKKGTEYTSIFPADYLRALFAKNERGMSGFFEGDHPLLETIHVQMGDDYPMIIGAESPGILLRYLIAPRIQSE